MNDVVSWVPNVIPNVTQGVKNDVIIVITMNQALWTFHSKHTMSGCKPRILSLFHLLREEIYMCTVEICLKLELKFPSAGTIYIYIHFLLATCCNSFVQVVVSHTTSKSSQIVPFTHWSMGAMSREPTRWRPLTPAALTVDGRTIDFEVDVAVRVVWILGSASDWKWRCWF